MKLKLLPRWLAAGVILSGFTAAAYEDTNALPLFKPKVKTVAAFKNGLAFVLRTGEATPKDGWLEMGPLPPATLGSLWIGTDSKSSPVTEVVASKERVTKDAEITSMDELLAANTGHPVEVTCAYGSVTKTFDGRLLPTDSSRDSNGDDGTTTDAPRFGSYGNYYRPPETSAGFILLQTTNGGQAAVVSLKKDAVLSAEVLDEPNLRVRQPKEEDRLRVHVGGGATRAEISVAGLEKGIVWSPSYRIDLIDDKQASIELDAALVNDVEDLDHADVSFVVGYPNFTFADVISPMSLQQSVADFVQALATGGNATAGRFINGLAQSVVYNTPHYAAAGDGTGYATGHAPAGEQGEDLYFYHENGLTLKKGDRASVSILKTTVPYEDLYQWEVSDSMSVDDRGYQVSPQYKSEDLVWHVLRLENQGQQPWTTAPAFVVEGSLPVAQDTLGYTPPGGRSFLKLTVATDVRAEQSQAEIGRKPMQTGPRNFDEITVKGTLKLTNLKNEAIAMTVRKSLVGEVLDSPQGNVTKVTRNLTAVNPNSEIEWEFKLPANKDRELTYQYRVLLMR